MSARHDEAGIGRGDSRGNVPRTADDRVEVCYDSVTRRSKSEFRKPENRECFCAAADDLQLTSRKAG